MSREGTTGRLTYFRKMELCWPFSADTLNLNTNTYVRVEREVQVLSELGYRGAAPVLKHVKVGLALILLTHNNTARGHKLVHKGCIDFSVKHDMSRVHFFLTV